MLQQVKTWLAAFPLWENTRLWVDKTDYLPNSAGLICQGLEQVSQKTDILGDVTGQTRCRFTLHWVVSDKADPQDMAQKLLELQNWVLAQSAAGTAPRLGAHTQWLAQAGKREELTHAMTAVYTVDIIAQYQCKFPQAGV